MRVGRAEIQLVVSPGGYVPSGSGCPYYAAQRQAWRVQARPKVAEPALSCAPVGASTPVESWTSHLLSFKCACHGLFATTSCRPLCWRGPGQAARCAMNKVPCKPSKLKASMD